MNCYQKWYALIDMLYVFELLSYLSCTHGWCRHRKFCTENFFDTFSCLAHCFPEKYHVDMLCSWYLVEQSHYPHACKDNRLAILGLALRVPAWGGCGGAVINECKDIETVLNTSCLILVWSGSESFHCMTTEVVNRGNEIINFSCLSRSTCVLENNGLCMTRWFCWHFLATKGDPQDLMNCTCINAERFTTRKLDRLRP